jgi:hypothetical protein
VGGGGGARCNHRVFILMAAEPAGTSLKGSEARDLRLAWSVGAYNIHLIPFHRGMVNHVRVWTTVKLQSATKHSSAVLSVFSTRSEQGPEDALGRHRYAHWSASIFFL